MRTLLLFLLCGPFFLLPGFGQDGLKMYEKEIVIPTYQVDLPDKIPYFYTGRAYQGAQGRVYPYAFDGNLTDNKEEVSYKGLFLENDFLEICVLPELGGRLYSMIDKTNGYNVIYKNNVIKPAMIGMLGAWVSGGVEWNVPHHHRASTFMPTDYELVENPDGSKTIWVGELEIRHQIRWMVGLTLFPDNARLQVDIRYINQTAEAKQFLIWANTAVHTNDKYQVVYSPQTEFATYHRKIDFTRWPVSNERYRGNQFNNTDISWWKNTPEGGSFFAWEDQGEFVAGLDHGQDAGLCVVGNRNLVIGKKLWTWGTTPRADMWESILTDDDGPYIEIMTGAYSNNQPDYSWCHPYFTKAATMHFMPLRGMSSVKESTLDAAVNFEMQADNSGLVEVHTYASFENATVSLQNGLTTLWQTTATLNPSSPQKWTVDIPEGMSYYDLSVVVRDQQQRELVRYHPQEKAVTPLPETVKPAKAPDEIETAEELAFTGLRLEQIFNPSVSPLSYYQEAIKREPHNAFANLRIGAWYLKEGIFDQAETYLQYAVDKWTTDYTRSKDCESLYLLALTKLALDKEQAAYDLFYRASWDYTWYGASHLQLSMIESKRGDYSTALAHIDKALSVDINNIRAQEIRLSLLRTLESGTEHQEQLAQLLATDPLNLYAYSEQVLATEISKPIFTKKMRGEIQNYLDLAVKLGNMGLFTDAITILESAAVHTDPLLHGNPLIPYFRGYYELLSGNQQVSQAAFQQAAKLKTDFCFPFRYETEKVLEAAISQNPTDFQAWYLLGNLLYDHQPEKAIEKWEQAVKIEYDFPMAHRNLAFSADHTENNPQKAKDHIAMAIRNDPTEPVFYFEQDNYALKVGESPEDRLELLEKAGKVIENKDNPLARRVYLELLCGQENDALNTLQSYHFRKVEGVGNIHNVWVDAWLLTGKQQLAKGKSREALKRFERSLEYPQNLDIGRNSREGQSHYFIGLALEKSGKKKLARTHYEEAVSKRFNTDELYYQGKAFQRLGETEKATEVFQGMLERGNELIQRINENDFFSIFGDKGSDNVRLADAYALKGLAHWGLGENDLAEELFEKALTHDPANFTAKTRLFE